MRMAIALAMCVMTDDDGDGVADGADNCPLMANSDQANADGDSVGDMCDDDDDGMALRTVLIIAR